MESPLVSVIVPTKNSGKHLTLCLHDLVNQTYPNTEIIVVDNSSTDETLDIADHYTDNIYQIGPERATQDNFGVLMAKGEIIWLTGSDFRFDLDYIEKGVAKLQEGYDAIYASVLTDRNVKHFWGRVKALERQCYIGNDTIESSRFFWKRVWVNIGGFDEKLIQVEEDFQHRLDKAGYKSGRILSFEYHMHEEKNLSAVFKKSRYYGQFMGHYLQKHRKRGLWQLQPFRNYYRALRHPLLFLGLIIYKIVQYAGGLRGMYDKNNMLSQSKA